MNYVQSSLMPGEKIISIAKIHWIDFFSLTISVFGMLLSLLISVSLWPVFITGIFLLIQNWLNTSSTELAITNKRIIAKIGCLHRKTAEVTLNRVECIHIFQSRLGRVFNFGTVLIEGRESENIVISKVCTPFQFKNFVSEAITLHSTISKLQMGNALNPPHEN
uniref:YdbS-like PH domain-containing protein n=1 Tax=Curvibacter symbiont subsp. Hydra magnipapillata TaxID=667019 RepID=C9Y945_CURXX|nr:hypothetical protein Csp_A06460 [Curvibacter putative symbiont of Hydra magnipapillata]